MPLPDADKKSPRVYTNLQNLDLDNVTFANIQATGNPISVEEMNEDEMRRLVLVNLARLVTAGEWTGLLTAGGGGQTAATYYPAVYPLPCNRRRLSMAGHSMQLRLAILMRRSSMSILPEPVAQ